jgi:MFS family permease
LILGRLIWGVGHALAMVSGITAIVRDTQPRGHAVSLNAFEMSGMCGVLFGMVAAGLLPREWPWNVSLAVASSPVLLGIALLPSLLRAVPADHRAASARPLFAQADKATGAASAAPQAQTPHLAVLAVAAGATIAFAWSAVGQFLLPLRASREFGLDRVGVASLVAVPQFVDVAVLLPLGALADRTSRARALGWMLILFAGGVAAVAFGNLPVAILGCVLFGVGLAGWMLPVSLLNQGAEPGSIAWRTALYRLAVDAGIFLGPLLGGFLLSRSLLGIGSAVVVALLTILGLRFLLRSHSAHRSPDQTRMTAP